MGLPNDFQLFKMEMIFCLMYVGVTVGLLYSISVVYVRSPNCLALLEAGILLSIIKSAI